MRVLVAIVVSYLFAVILIVAGTMAATSAFGPSLQGAQAMPHLLANFATNFVAAVLAGYVCMRIAPAGRALIAMGGLVLAFTATAAISARAASSLDQPHLAIIALLGVSGLIVGAMVRQASRGRVQT